MTAAPVPLCTVDDVRALLDIEPTGDIPASIAAASARFRAEARNHITANDYAGIVPLYASEATLPQTPVLAVHEVRRVSDTGAPGAAITGWRLHSDTLTLHNARVPGYLLHGLPRSLFVVWQAGYEPIPEDVRATVAAIAARALTEPAPQVNTAHVGTFPTTAPAPTVTREERAIAHAYRPRRTPTR